jgi:hypothetical protein
MDHFGIGAAVRGAFNMLMITARRTGRTTSLVRSVQDGDRIVTPNESQARLIRQMLRDYDKHHVEVIVVEPRSPQRLLERGTSQGRTVFEHTWVEDFYKAGIERIESEVDYLQNTASGFGPDHIKTKQQAEQLARWGVIR